MIPETGAPVCRGEATLQREVATKQAWWSQIFARSLQTQFPLLKAIVYFEEAKIEQEMWKDWRVTGNTTVRAAFMRDYVSSAQPNFLWFSDVFFNGNGSAGIYT